MTEQERAAAALELLEDCDIIQEFDTEIWVRFDKDAFNEIFQEKSA